LVDRALSAACGNGGPISPGLLSQRSEWRRIRGAPSPLLRGAPLSKSAISWLVGRLEAPCSHWRSRSFATVPVVFPYRDAIVLRVRIAKKVISGPVLVASSWGGGQKMIVDLELFQSEFNS